MHTNLQSIPGSHSASAYLASVLAATATEKHMLFVAPFACRVKKIYITPQAAVTGDTTNTKHLNVQDEGSSGSGDTEIANLDLATGTNLVAFDEKAISESLDVQMAEGDTLTLEYEKQGTGVLIPELLARIVFEPDYAVAP